MPQDEEENKSTHTADSPANIAAWWHKFHFSGRVIMCSVLFGLGLLLIGGLIFAINLNSDSKSNTEETSNEVTPKAPYNYVGSVVMGIGGFIVIVGVIMCLFETQVCRKKTGDARPLISERTDDVEGKASDPTGIPSTSHSHKNHKHKSRKTAASPRKSKSRHAKTHCHDENQKKLSSSKSPPVSINQSKSFMTSSEDKFLTPPNTLEDKATAERTNAEIQTSTSLMKSFASSETSWTKSTEFLTPSTSFRDTSVSMENSVEIDEKQGQVNFKTSELSETGEINPEYMTPLTIEEDRIQRLFIRVKNEQMEMAKRQMDEKLSAANFSSGSQNDTNSSQTAIKDSKEDSDVRKSVDNISIPTNELPLSAPPAATASKDTEDQIAEINTNQLIEKSSSEENSAPDKQNEVHGESPTTVDKIEAGVSDVNTRVDKEKLVILDDEKIVTTSTHDSLKSPMNEVKGESNLDSHTEPSNISVKEDAEQTEEQVELESSMSSDETVISRDSSIEKPKDDEVIQNMKALTKENFTNEPKALNNSESQDDVKPITSQDSNDPNSSSDIIKEKEPEASDLKHCENDKKEDKTIEKISEDKTIEKISEEKTS